MPNWRDFLSPGSYVSPVWIASGQVFSLAVIWRSIGTPEGLPHNLVIIFVAVTLFLVGSSWWYGATETRKKRIDAADNTAMRKQISELIEKVSEKSNAHPVSYSSEYVDLRRLNSAELRERAIAYATRMRAFEAERKLKQEFLYNSPNYGNISEQERDAAWSARTANLMRESTEARNEFRSRLLPEALTLERAIAQRLGRALSDDSRPYALRYGTLAGPSPVADAADYIEAMAREL